MDNKFERGYLEGFYASDTLQDTMSEDELRYHLEQAVDLAIIENAGYWSGRLTTYGSDVTLSDGTILSY